MATTLLETDRQATMPADVEAWLGQIDHELRELDSAARMALVGASREHALRVADALEAVLRVGTAMQLTAARAVDEAAPVSVAALVLVDHRGDLGVPSDSGCDPVTADPTPSPYRRSVDLLANRLRITRSEASRRIKLA